MTRLGIPDRPVEKLDDDTLEIRDYARALAAFLQECDTPITVGIQGDWGAGKTSLMNMVKELLEPEQNGGQSAVRTVLFNTWMYSQFDLGDQLSLLMLSSFVKRLTDGRPDVSGKKLLQWAGKVGPNIVAKKLTGMSWKELTDGGGVSLGDETNVLEKLKEEFKDLCGELTAGDARNRIVFFVDDLDRLPPEKAVELLEVMKNFLDVPGVIFVLACDYAVIAQGVEARLGISNRQDGGRSFFDKIIQVPFKMPVHAYKLEKYVSGLLGRLEWRLESEEEVVSVYQRLLEYSIGFNPRSIKRLFNSILLVKMVLSQDEANQEKILGKPHMLRLLFAVVCMEMAHVRLHRYLASELTVARLSALASEEAFQELCSGGDTPYEGEDPGARAVDFATLFYQLVDEDKNQDISQDELEALRTVFNVSSVTSVSEAPSASVRTRRRWDPESFHDKVVDVLGEETATKVREFFDFCLSDRRHGHSFGTGKEYGSFTVRFRFPNRSKPITTLSLWTSGGVWLRTYDMRASGAVGKRVADRLSQWAIEQGADIDPKKTGIGIEFIERPELLDSLRRVLKELINPAECGSPIEAVHPHSPDSEQE